jgi:hypothetical protein
MPRTIGLVAILVFAAVAAVASAVIPPPRPAPIATVVVPPPAGVPGAAAAAVPGATPPAQRRVSFSIADSAPAEEGKPLTFRITRSGDDGRVHEVRLNYDKNPSLLVNPPPSIRFEPGEPAQKDLVLQTAPGLPGGGNNDVEVRISSADDGAFIGVPRVGTGTITDVPLPPAVTYGLQADPNAKREQNVSFTLTRLGSLTPADVPYRVEQDQRDLFADAPSPPQARFLEGEPSTQIIVPAAQFSPCGGSLTVRLSQPDGTELSATAEFSEPVPDWCNPPPPPPWWIILIDWMRVNIALVLGGIALIGGIIAHHIFKPPVEVEPSLEIKPGAASFQPLEEPASRWPKFGADVTIEPGDSYVTQPLPALEPDDG